MGVISRTVLLAGASGLVGGLALRRLLASPRQVRAVLAPSRRGLDLSDPRLLAPVLDFSAPQADAALADLIAAQPGGKIDVFISCLGTTIKAAGSRPAFIAVDRELVLRLAQLAFKHGARHGILVSSVGASRQSGNFYLRVKGEVEDAFERIGFSRLDILQPGLLLGARQEHRPGEAWAQKLAPLGNGLLVGKMRNYRAIEADTVAAAITALVGQDQAGQFTHGHDGIRAFASLA
jgi:uncharacterized protein YbjT (DUF2867 family)